MSESLGEKPKTFDLLLQIPQAVRAAFGSEHSAVIAEQKRERPDDLAAGLWHCTSAGQILDELALRSHRDADSNAILAYR